ncbi:MULTISPECIES: Csu type fimbrial protein [Sphingomonas]|uniref:Spore coat U domain-containing protein n=1 Tax=Sphingomonas molluscorum TaxID=418184 RepID=A0ABU8Q5R8_9SPHN|nr:spore coat U domain-containing protein [Sphingomonas sp. JUb134]MBM7405979.1 spore coat protein U-like protein [Sphingomonas sp. JUb134]
MICARIALGILGLIPAGIAHAQVHTATGELEVKLLVTSSCEVSGSSTGGVGTAVLDFGSTDLLLEAIDADTGTTGVQTFDVLCNPGVAYTLGFGPGQNATEVANRAMRRDGGDELVRYQLYTTAARSAVLVSYAGTGTGTKIPVQVFGRVPAQTAPVPGNYRDVVTVTVTF